jgi:hypothetical protein
MEEENRLQQKWNSNTKTLDQLGISRWNFVFPLGGISAKSTTSVLLYPSWGGLM